MATIFQSHDAGSGGRSKPACLSLAVVYRSNVIIFTWRVLTETAHYGCHTRPHGMLAADRK